jgi:hypothetical protein
MNTKHLKIIITLALAATVNLINLNAADLAASPKGKASQIKTAQAMLYEPDLIARNSDLAASPKVLANLPQLAKAHTTLPTKTMVACSCCKS